MIKAFKIYGLFGVYDVDIPFDDKVKILIGENGLGKTQVLNMLYHTLAGNVFKLYDFSFQRIELSFCDGLPTYTLDKEILEAETKSLYTEANIDHIIDVVGEKKYSDFWQEYTENGNLNMSRNNLNSDDDLIISLAESSITALKSRQKFIFQSPLSSFKGAFSEKIHKNQLLYFPTYRLIEENLHNFGVKLHNTKENAFLSAIQFGMNDVKIRFRRVEEQIEKLLKRGLADFTNDILKIVINPPKPNRALLNSIKTDDLEIILSRVGDELPKEQKEAVREIVMNRKQIAPVPAYLLQKLLEIYDKQKELDNAIQDFRDVCNSYLIDKKVIYNESKIKIFIQSEITGEPLSLSQLSSGEKQLLTIFSKIYLSDQAQKFIMLFDEPELSLGLKWQRKLLADIVASGKCEFLLAATHSPFIFDNELDQYAVGLSEYISTNIPINV